MCGFLGEISTQLIPKDSFQKLLDLSTHRGPDQQGFWKDEVCQLGFNRLAILDLSENGKQPLLSPLGKFAMVFNGEVYNYKNLQSKYNISDEELRSGSDSEILVHLIQKISIEDFAKELNGMFAIAIYDLDKKKVHLIRDFAGIKPLFYGTHQNGLVFGSQFDQIFQHQAFENKKLRPEIMKEYFGLGYMQAPNTVFDAIFQVEPGQIITYSFNENKIISKFNFFEWKTSNIIKESDKAVIDKTKIILSQVVQYQLNADVPVATFLSGGIDSPLVAAIAKQTKSSLKAYTFGIDNEVYNESDIAHKIATQLNLDQTIDTINEKQLLQIIEEHFNYFSEPFGDESSIPTFLITKNTKHFATVMLSGDGGDEVFWGYPRFIRSLDHLYWFKIPLMIRKMMAPFYRKIFKNTSSAIDIFNNFEDWILYKQIHFSKLDKLVPKTKFSNELLAIYKFKKPLNKKNSLLYLKENEFYAHLQKVLRKVDLMSMANSLEVRVPFLDKQIIEFSNTIIPEYGIKHKTPKLILRQLLNQFVDKKITDLPKKGFSIPIDNWLKNDLKNDVIETILKNPFYGNEFIDVAILKEILDDFYNKNKGVSLGIWHLYTWQKWAIKYKLN